MRYTKLILVLLFATSAIQSQDLTGIRIFLNPGHGGYDSDDRYIAATGFWESLSNLHKGLFLRQQLQALNATVGISRTTNNTSDDLPLSVIGQMANDFNADYFHSIHSNAFNTQVNYPLVLYRGYDDQPVFAAAKTMAIIMFQDLLECNYTYWQYSFINARGDWSFYGNTSGLGVLRSLTMPGTLSEGSFHDYIPESWRLMNMEYKEHEATAIARSFLDFYSQPGYGFGYITGILRDPDLGVSYYAIPQTKDPKKPINNAKVTLLPEGKEYFTDQMNNGYFFFDSLAPGSYKLMFESGEYYVDSANVTVLANKSSKVEKYLEFDSTKSPYVTVVNPPDSTTNVPAISSVDITFSRAMIFSSLVDAFSISPQVNGSLEVLDGGLTLRFTPEFAFEILTEYSINISTEAKSVFGISLEQPFSSVFTTAERNSVTLENAYPVDGSIDISRTVQIRLVFDAHILQGSLAGRVNLYDETGTRITVKNVLVFPYEGKGYIFFEPYSELKLNHEYRLMLGAGIEDVEGFPLWEDIEIRFRTETENYLSGSVMDMFESMGTWQQPTLSALTIGVDSLKTRFKNVSNQKKNGSKSGKIEYKFTDIDGIAAVENSNPYLLGNSGLTETGVWVFGDNSRNLFGFILSDAGGNKKTVHVDTVDWTGWKLKHLVPDASGLSGDIFFSGFYVARNGTNGADSGDVYLDDLQKNIVTGLRGDEDFASLSYDLGQNYPNPFNPETIINYELKNHNHVKLCVYDVLGREVAILVDTEQAPGRYAVNFNAAGLSSGIYFYSINASGTEGSGFSAVRKMILLK
ncbi:MAG: Ig-like domain-containing protein [Ignavibacteriales bacterium]|nr:Ig-like domain-containing protein [Ignavibacteriales bacterium]MCF8438197.1 Ig-like domain-containing protein [Ignavibacteriales bacterium]